jgi:hypothetical protein
MALAIICGAAILPLVSLYLSKAGLGFNRVVMAIFTICLISVSGLLSFLYKKRNQAIPVRGEEYISDHRWIFFAAIPILFVVLIGAFYHGSVYYQWAWDPFCEWQFRGLEWFTQGNISYIPHRQPPLYSILLSFDYLFNMKNSGFVVTLMFVVILVFVLKYCFTKKLPFALLLFGLAFVFCPEVAKRSFILTPEISILALITASVILMLEAIHSKDLTLWIISAVLLGSYSGYRGEAVLNIAFLLIPFYLFLIIKKNWKPLLVQASIILGIFLSIRLLYPPMENLQFMNALKSPALLLQRILDLFPRVIQLQFNEYYLVITGILILSWIINGFRLGKAKLPFWAALFFLASILLTFSLIDNFWDKGGKYVHGWFGGMDFVYEGSSGINRYTLPVNGLFLLVAGLMFKQGVEEARYKRLLKFPSIIVLILFNILIISFGIYKYQEMKKYIFSHGSRFNVISQLHPIATFSGDGSSPDRQPLLQKIPEGVYDIKLFYIKNDGPWLHDLAFVLFQNGNYIYKLPQVRSNGGLLFPAFVGTTDWTLEGRPLKAGNLELAIRVLHSKDILHIVRVELINKNIHKLAKYVSWEVLIGFQIFLAFLWLGRLIVHIRKDMRFVKVGLLMAIVMMLMYNFYIGFIAYAKELSRAIAQKRATFADSIHMDFSGSWAEILRLMNENTPEKARVGFIGPENNTWSRALLLRKFLGHRKIDDSSGSDLDFKNKDKLSKYDFIPVIEPSKHGEIKKYIDEFPNKIKSCIEGTYRLGIFDGKRHPIQGIISCRDGITLINSAAGTATFKAKAFDDENSMFEVLIDGRSLTENQVQLIELFTQAEFPVQPDCIPTVRYDLVESSSGTILDSAKWTTWNWDKMTLRVKQIVPTSTYKVIGYIKKTCEGPYLLPVKEFIEWAERLPVFFTKNN